MFLQRQQRRCVSDEKKHVFFTSGSPCFSAEAIGRPGLAILASVFNGPLWFTQRFNRRHIASATVATVKEGKQGLFGR